MTVDEQRGEVVREVAHDSPSVVLRGLTREALELDAAGTLRPTFPLESASDEPAVIAPGP
jgi:hypothetical protein